MFSRGSGLFHQAKKQQVFRNSSRKFSTSEGRTPVIVSAARTPIGSFNGTLASFTAPQLGAQAVKAAIQRAGIKAEDVEEVILGNVVGAGIGQAPARQAAVFAGLPYTVPCTTVNKVCSSGMKTIMFAAQSILLGQQDIVVAGGFESMSNVPYYVPKGRTGYRYGHGELLDGLIKDGLWDAFDNHHMGSAGDHCAKSFGFTREDQDNFAIESYKRAAAAHKNGDFKNEMVPIEIKSKKGTVEFSNDEDHTNVDFTKMLTLRPAFGQDGTVTAANASTLNDGASALVIMSLEKAKSLGLKPLAKILSFADAERKPVEFTIAPSDAISKTLKRAGLSVKDIDYFEINEAFSVVGLANMKLSNIPHEKLNVLGGAVALGHPIGSSGSRIVVTLAHLLQNRGKEFGVAAICNGGGGASCVLIQRV